MSEDPNKYDAFVTRAMDLMDKIVTDMTSSFSSLSSEIKNSQSNQQNQNDANRENIDKIDAAVRELQSIVKDMQVKLDLHRVPFFSRVGKFSLEVLDKPVFKSPLLWTLLIAVVAQLFGLDVKDIVTLLFGGQKK